MKKHPALTIQRITQFVRRFQAEIRRERLPLDVEMAGPVGRIPYQEALCLPYAPVTEEMNLTPAWATYWFRLRGQIPATWQEKPVDLLFHCQSEALLWIGGKPAQGLNFEGALPGEEGGRIDARLPAAMVKDGSIILEVEAACNMLYGAVPNTRYLFTGAEVALFDQEAWDLFHDLFMPSEFLNRLLRQNNPGMPWLGHHVPEKLSPWQGYLLERMNDICNAGSPDDRSTWPAIREIVAEIYSHKNASYCHEISALGHCHIDTAWRWPLAEAKRKCARSFSTALSYMERYPEYQFACSQAFQYQWMKESYPSIYENIKKAVARGQWIPVGGSWVEPDCNLPSGESLVRQFLYGKRFFQQEFGWDCREAWNPDVFGCSGALPQILRGVGIEFFLTQKLFWNQFNKPQYQNFNWRGIDGSEVLTHFPPAENYNALSYESLFQDLLMHESRSCDHDRTNEGLLLYGFGDGGGGPTTHMIEILRRAQDFQGVPRVNFRTSEQFFHRLKKRLRSTETVDGELYLELHRGTYTSQAANKLGNRRNEILLRNLEILYSVALHTRDIPYPSDALERLWKVLLVNQFHDILPGSSITEVHEESRADYAAIEAEGTSLLTRAADAMGESDSVSVVNLCGWDRLGLLECDAPVAPSAQKSWQGRFLVPIEVPSCGTSSLDAAVIEGAPVTINQKGDTFVLENDFLQAVLSSSGHLTSLVEKSSGREVVPPHHQGNRFVLFEDRPVSADAWDVDIFHLEKPTDSPVAVSAKVIERGPFRVGVEFSYQFGPSTLIQRSFLSTRCDYLEFACEVDWHHRHQFLKVEFPVLVQAPDAAFETQFGYIRRPTHFNSSQDIAKFEVPAHRWIDLSEPGFGVSLWTDCKYGYAVHQNVMRISLLRGPEDPDPTADIGRHTFRYAICPHTASLADACIVRKAYEFSMPWILVKGATQRQSWFSVDSPNMIIDTVKKAEDSDGLILRIYECNGSRGTARFSTTLPCRAARLTNLLEKTVGDLTLVSGGITLDYTPFQIITIALDF